MAKHVRWCFNATKWKPTKEQWLNLTAALPTDELERINKFVFQEDAKTSLIGQALIRAFLSKSLNCPSNKISVVRNEHGRPQLSENHLKTIGCKLDFNVSHSGDYCVFVGYQNSEGPEVKLGVDVTQIIKKNSKEELDRFLHLMSKREFLKSEWKSVENATNDRERCVQFTRLWCLKESFIKAIGLGLAYDLRKIEFTLNNDEIKIDKFSTSTSVRVDGINDHSWKFLEIKLDQQHIVALGYKCDNFLDLDPNINFSEVDIDDIIEDLTPRLDLNDNNWLKFTKKLIKVN